METDILAPIAETVETGARLFLTTPFEQYTVTEGFLLLLLVFAFIWLIVQFFKGGF